MSGQPYQVKTVDNRVYRVTARTPEEAMQLIATRHQVAVVAWRESKAPEDGIGIGMPPGSDS
jgi:hypothetical protein